MTQATATKVILFLRPKRWLKYLYLIEKTILCTFNSFIKFIYPSSILARFGEFFIAKQKPPLRWFLFCLKFLVFENQQRRSLLGEKSSGFTDVLSLRKQELQSNSFPRSEIQIARKLSKLEPKVLLRNFPSVKQIQDNLGAFA